MAPTPETIRVAIEALRTDAQDWDSGSAELTAAGASASGLTMDAFHFSYFAEELFSIATTYGRVQVKLADVLAQGAQNFSAVGAALSAAASQYEADEAAGVHRAQGIY